MNICKKISFTLQTLLISAALIPSAYGAQVLPTIDSGKTRLVNIMTHSQNGINSYNTQHIKNAETQNISADLNIPEIAKFFGCKTIIGQTYLTQTLQMPLSPTEKNGNLANRQNAIKALVKYPALKKEVEQLLEQARQEEQDVVTLLSEQFVGRTCPELQNLELIKKQTPFMYPFFRALTVNQTMNTVGTVVNVASLPLFIFLFKNFAQETSLKAKLGMNYTESAVSAAYYGLFGAYISYSNYKDYSKATEKRSKLHALNQLIVIAEKLEQLCQTHSINNQFNIGKIKNSDGGQIISQLKHRRYAKKNSYIFNTPAVHTFLYKVYENENQLALIFATIAELDAYNAIATKIIESKNQKNKLCFVTFADQEKPLIESTSFWNVLVKDAVTNNLSESKNIILTGPNAGGKTTAIRAILQNIVLGQTYGVAAAQSFNFTPFDIINSYLNISDDLINGKSLFVSEVKRAQDILQILKSLPANKKFFFALDELFTGTVAEDGETCAYEFVKRIADFKDAQFIYATHFHKLKELGNENAVCANYKVDAPVKNAENKLVYPFTLSHGANTSNVALDIAREANLFA